MWSLLRDRYTRKHLIPPEAKSRIRLVYSSCFLRLEKPVLEGCSVLLVGAGSSAEPDNVRAIAHKYSNVVTLNSALFIYPEADFHSFEFATQDQVMCKEMIEWIDNANYKKLFIKAHSIWPMSRCNRKRLKSKQREIQEHFDNSGHRLNYPILRGIRQNHFPGYSDLTNYDPLVRANRGLYQWSGSLSLWLDVVHTSPNISRLGLIGTDFGGPYSSAARWFKPSANNKEHLLEQDRSKQGGPLPFTKILSHLTRKGYLNPVMIDNYHYSEDLRRSLNNRRT